MTKNDVLSYEFFFALGWLKENIKNPPHDFLRNTMALVEHMEKTEKECK